MTYQDYCLNELGYKTITTYWDDFSIADHFGISAIKDTYKRALFNNDYKMLTELYMVLNHKIWFWYKKNETIAKTYNQLWENLYETIMEMFNPEELQYFYEITD